MTASNKAAAQQAAIALDQWNTTKAYMPAAMARAEREDVRAQRAADQASDDSTYYRGVADHQVKEAAKAEPYQQRMRDTADMYSSGKAGDDQAGRDSADVEQGFGNATSAMARGASRMGLNPGSDSFASTMGDMYTQKALASAGAQTNARSNARTKAEGLVTQAAGAGQSSFSNGMGAGGMSGGFNSGAVALGASGQGGFNSAQSTFNQGANGAANTYGQVSSAYRANAVESAKNPGFDFVAGLATSAVKAYAGAMTGGATLAAEAAAKGSGSDRRLKTDIKRVGTLDNGLAVYTYRYRAGGPFLMGVMADEVEKVVPRAVSKRAIDGEYDAVFYGAL